MMIFAAIMIMPIQPVLNVWDKILKGKMKWVKPVAVIAVIFISIMAFPTDEVEIQTETVDNRKSDVGIYGRN